MDFIAEFGFDVKQGRQREFQRWLVENESKFAAAHPSGSEYIGTYAVVQTSEKHAGGYRQLVRMESYGTQDSFAAALKEDGEFSTLLNEMAEFFDMDRNADWSSSLYKSVTDVSMLKDI
jgi:hypothetical protein